MDSLDLDVNLLQVAKFPMSSKSSAFDIFIESLKKILLLFGQKNADLMAIRAADALVPIIKVPVGNGELKFFSPDWTAVRRAQTLFLQEPDTIAWIDSFEKGSVFYDIGANVGIYSLYSAYKSDVHVFAFEPAAPCYYVLNKNIELNGLDGQISALCVAFSDVTCLDSLYMEGFSFGKAMNYFGASVEHRQERAVQADFKQGMVGLTVDEFVERMGGPVPQHIKIDVDGIEDKIILGAERTLAHPALQSVLVEIDLRNREYFAFVVEKMKKAGFAAPPKTPETGQRGNIVNYIFTRSGKASS